MSFMDHQLKPGETVDLTALPTSGKELHDDRDKAEKEFKKFRKEIADWQPRLYAEGKQKLLIVFQAMDAGGKDGTTRSVFKGVNPQGVDVISFKAPSKEELAHDYLWRIHQNVPPTGMIHVFNRSHYEDVLVVRVDDIVPEKVWRPRFEQINQFEKFLTDTGTTVLKFFLHISKEEQKERFQERLDIPEKQWKFSKGDLGKRKQWDDYMVAFSEALSECTTDHSPWHVIPADQNWYRDWAIAGTIMKTLERMNPQYPDPEQGLSEITID